MLTIRLKLSPLSAAPSFARPLVSLPPYRLFPTPDVFPGSVIVRVLACSVEPATAHILEGGIPGLTLLTPIVPGARTTGRVASIGSDTTAFQIGQLAMLEPFYPWPR